MNERNLIAETTAEVFRRNLDAPFETIWATLEETGLLMSAIPSQPGGEQPLADALSVIFAASGFPVATPLAEHVMLASWLLSMAGLPISGAPHSAAADGELTLQSQSGGWLLSGRATRVPWGRHSKRVVLLVPHGGRWIVALVDPSLAAIDTGENLAGEPRDTLVFDQLRIESDMAAPVPVGIDPQSFRLRGAFTRAAQMTGAMQRILELSTTHARTREQFGRPIAAFQAIQQQISMMAAEVAAARAATQWASESLMRSNGAAEIASAKIRSGEAAGRVATIAHQVHGAIGFTAEHELHRFTKRIWSWREEFGSEQVWAHELGRQVIAAGSAGLWPSLVRGFSTHG
jgi:acyl-CoA dehydrogenase